MKMKFLKKMVAVFCVSAITTSCVTGATSAVKVATCLNNNNAADHETISNIKEIDGMIKSSIKSLDAILRELRVRKLNRFDEGKLLSRAEQIKDSLKRIYDLALSGKVMVDNLLLNLECNIVPSIKRMEEFCCSFELEKDEDLFDSLDDELNCDDSVQNTILRTERVAKFSHDITEKYSKLYAKEGSIVKVKDAKEQGRFRELIEKVRGFYNKTLPYVKDEKNKEKD